MVFAAAAEFGAQCLRSWLELRASVFGASVLEAQRCSSATPDRTPRLASLAFAMLALEWRSGASRFDVALFRFHAGD